jgi:DNA-binding transcriptional LysR family regulator
LNIKTSLNLDALIVLDAIARKQSFAAAAEDLHRVPSSVTYVVQKLENNLQVRLFDRSGHRAQLTAAGRTLLEEGRHLMDMADAITRRVRRIDTGWESEFRIAFSDLLPRDRLLELCEEFYAIAPDTRLSLSSEVLAGAWDALLSGRADFVIGADGDGPTSGGFTSRVLGEVEFVFALSPHHPLASLPQPLRNSDIRRHRAVAVADSSRSLPSRTYGILAGQPVLTVPSLDLKRLAHIKALGIGYLPLHLIGDDLDSGRLVIRATEDSHTSRPTLHYAWRNHHQGQVLSWFQQRLLGDDQFTWFE